VSVYYRTLAALSTAFGDTITAANVDDLFAEGSRTATYSISGTTLTLTWEGGSPETYTKL